jgi:hypothetical protein
MTAEQQPKENSRSTTPIILSGMWSGSFSSNHVTFYPLATIATAQATVQQVENLTFTWK